MECTSHHLAQLAQPGAFNFEIGLVDGRPASKKLHKLVSEALDTGPLAINYSVESRFSKLATCRKSDMVLFRGADASMKVAQVQGHFDVEGIPVSMVTLYHFIKQDTARSSFWEPSTGGAEWVQTQCILDTLVYSILPSGKLMVLLATF